MITIDKEHVRKTIGGKALLEYQDNPAFVSFRLLSFQGANAACKKLNNAGYDAFAVDEYVKLKKSKFHTVNQ